MATVHRWRCPKCGKVAEVFVPVDAAICSGWSGNGFGPHAVANMEHVGSHEERPQMRRVGAKDRRRQPERRQPEGG